LGVVLVSCISLSVLVKAHADVDPAMAGTWETSGVNEHGPWKLTWEIQADSSYFLSGALSDSGMIGSGDGRWHTLSNVTKQSADGTYTMSDADRMLGAGPLGSAAWTRVPGKAPKTSSGPAPSAASSSDWNPFANAFSKPSVTPTALSEEEEAELVFDKAYASRDKDSRDRLEKKARSGIAMAQELFGEQLDQEKNFTEAETWFRKAAEQGDADAMLQLGFYYRDGTSIHKDPSQAMTWFCKAAELGNKDAPSDIGNFYRDGMGVAKDAAAAVQWYRKGAA